MRSRSIFLPSLFLVVTISAAISFSAAARAQHRVALVVGNSAYRSIARLDNPMNDARLMADTLRTLGFELVGGGPQIDLDKADFDAAVQNFGQLLQGADVGLFYYAGHGLQLRGANYLVPIGADPVREADVDFQMLDVNLVLRQMEGAGTKLNLVILDACRNNPFGGRGLRAADGGLAQMRAPEGTLISFATQPGNVAQDGHDGNSPYTKALTATIQRPGLGIFDAFNEVGLAVKRATGGSQQPWVSSSPIDGSFYFAGGPSVAALPPPAAPPPQAAAPRAAEPVVTGNARRFDGDWTSTLSCQPAAGALGYSFQFAAQIKDGVFRAQHGAEGTPGFVAFDGKIQPDGTAEIHAKGLTGPSVYTPGAATPPGTDYGYHVTGRFNDTKGNGTRTEGRPCNFVFVKK